MDATSEHRPVLLDEAVAALRVRPGGAYLDATLGRGGHAAAILSRLDATGRLIAMDRDPQAIAAGRVRFGDDARVRLEQENFAMIAEVAARSAPARGLDGILLDLGVSSPQLDDAARGFSFRHDGPLDMRMDPSVGSSAAEWLATVEADALADVIRRLGEERFARRIARTIVAARTEAPIETTGRLAAIVEAAVPRRERERHPATRTFQAVRMHINDELGALDRALAAVPSLLAPGGRLVVISFHSLEDRRVKRFLRAAEGRESTVVRNHRGQVLPVEPPAQQRTLRVVGRPVTPSPEECTDNPRARSARLRVAERPA